MLDNKAAAPALEHRDGQEMRGLTTPRTNIVHRKRRLCKPLRRLAGTLAAGLLVAACTCLAEGLAGTPAYLPAALACVLAANGCAGVAVKDKEDNA